jgi:hypothetical protein
LRIIAGDLSFLFITSEKIASIANSADSFHVCGMNTFLSQSHTPPSFIEISLARFFGVVMATWILVRIPCQSDP